MYHIFGLLYKTRLVEVCWVNYRTV